ncbi:MAG: isoprenyl transferase [Pseudomonadota bacterium]|nr:isoprenyl transferase [Pseudomonadota bacterium]
MKPVATHLDGPEPPVHVAIIMDGNGRWAKQRNLPRVAGHKRGAEAVRAAIRASVDLGISYLTLYGFSLENWNRPLAEVTDLMGLLRLYLRNEMDALDADGVNIRFIGDRSLLADDIVELMEMSEQRTAENNRLHLIVALSYGARQEIIAAARDLAAEAAKGRLDPNDIDEAMFNSRLTTTDIPDPDLLIRTSGEQRISNFLLWQSAYAELVFTDTLWPDFAKADLQAAVDEYNRRERRFGSTVA